MGWGVFLLLPLHTVGFFCEEIWFSSYLDRSEGNETEIEVCAVSYTHLTLPTRMVV